MIIASPHGVLKRIGYIGARLGSRRDIRITVNDLGRRLYEEYAQRILRTHFSPMFRDLDKLSPQARSYVADALQDAMRGSDYHQSEYGTDEAP